jgi:hypothetical protein
VIINHIYSFYPSSVRTEIAFIPILQINEIYIHYYKT